MSNEALVLTHPGQISEQGSEHLVNYLERNTEDKDVIYVPGNAPDLPSSDLVHLPEGYFSGMYDDVIEKQDIGYLYEDAEELVENYSSIEVGGYHRDHCVQNTFDSLRAADGDAEVKLSDDLLFPLKEEDAIYEPRIKL